MELFKLEESHPSDGKLNLGHLTHPTWKSHLDGASSVIAGHPRSASDDDLRGTHLQLGRNRRRRQGKGESGRR